MPIFFSLKINLDFLSKHYTCISMQEIRCIIDKTLPVECYIFGFTDLASRFRYGCDLSPLITGVLKLQVMIRQSATIIVIMCHLVSNVLFRPGNSFP